MEIRNLMEDKVIQSLDEIIREEEAQGKTRYCTSPQCLTDVVCFVLNRIPQRYVSSGRGYGYLAADFQENTQLQVDIVTLVHEGLRRVTEIQRSFYDSETDKSPSIPEGADFLYFFPTLHGRVFDAITFEPLRCASVMLRLNGEMVKMMDSRWLNPFLIADQKAGQYAFWPKPVVADAAGHEKNFEFALDMTLEGYAPFTHYFMINCRAESSQNYRGSRRDFNLSDLFLVPVNSEDDSMQINPSDPD